MDRQHDPITRAEFESRISALEGQCEVYLRYIKALLTVLPAEQYELDVIATAVREINVSAEEHPEPLRTAIQTANQRVNALELPRRRSGSAGGIAR
ncbi:hypothetical protein [Lysobacter antibioticus]|uniref:Uncharacterized protein n=1 Tax=Lysobacter antibioticus TaxID=84531 RepID=A0A0S2FA46_LYSAN|nr:hypothetical protein [Lysobacter antibioticus]ALN80409.1 hypothetical protein LA76x_2276 [Lysobacter antibioticus]